MSQFEFSTKEEREAWRVLKPLYEKLFNGGGRIMLDLDEAASRFDEREATCGIEPLSATHFVLGAIWAHPDSRITTGGAIARIPATLVETGLLCSDGNWQLTDRGREVLANLNAMCKVSK